VSKDVDHFFMYLLAICTSFENHLFFFFLVILGFELRALYLLGRCFTTLSHSGFVVVLIT
jgi:hypothetical protein